MAPPCSGSAHPTYPAVVPRDRHRKRPAYLAHGVVNNILATNGFSPSSSICTHVTATALQGRPAGAKLRFDWALIDFSHLTPDERIQLAEQLWDSVEPANIGPDEAQTAELRHRRAALASDADPGEPWEAVIDDIAKRGE